ncbi:hypothetical protein [Geodermatophilus sp. SYSU D00684]
MSETPHALRDFAVRAGNQHRDLVSEHMRALRDADGDWPTYRRARLAGLGDHEVIDAGDRQRLERLIGYAERVDSGEQAPLVDVADAAQDIYSTTGSPVAVALASIMYDAAANTRTALAGFADLSALPEGARGPAMSDVDGGLVGAGFGVAAGTAFPVVGQLAGGLLGGIYGAAIGSLAWGIDHKQDAAVSGAPVPDLPAWMTSGETAIPQDPAALNILALGAGPLHNYLLRRMIRSEVPQVDRRSANARLRQEIRRRGMATAEEDDALTQLDDLCDSIDRATDVAEADRVVRDTRSTADRLLREDRRGTTNPFALCAASVLTDSVVLARDNETFGAAPTDAAGPAKEDANGLWMGAAVGVAGGGWGLLAGMVLGAGLKSGAWFADNSQGLADE